MSTQVAPSVSGSYHSFCRGGELEHGTNFADGARLNKSPGQPKDRVPSEILGYREDPPVLLSCRLHGAAG